jgi:hypothetical protein
MRTLLRRLVIASLLTVWFFPNPEIARAQGAAAAPAPPAQGTRAEITRYADREKQAENLQDFEGGRGGGIYISSGVVVVLLLIIIILILI